MKDRKGEIAFPSQDTQPTCLQGVMASSWPRAAQKHSAELFRASTRMRHRVFGPEEFISEASGPWTGFSVPVQRIEGEGQHRPGKLQGWGWQPGWAVVPISQPLRRPHLSLLQGLEGKGHHIHACHMRMLSECVRYCYGDKTPKPGRAALRQAPPEPAQDSGTTQENPSL